MQSAALNSPGGNGSEGNTDSLPVCASSFNLNGEEVFAEIGGIIVRIAGNWKNSGRARHGLNPELVDWGLEKVLHLISHGSSEFEAFDCSVFSLPYKFVYEFGLIEDRHGTKFMSLSLFC